MMYIQSNNSIFSRGIKRYKKSMAAKPIWFRHSYLTYNKCNYLTLTYFCLAQGVKYLLVKHVDLLSFLKHISTLSTLKIIYSFLIRYSDMYQWQGYFLGIETCTLYCLAVNEVELLHLIILENNFSYWV